MASSHFGGGLQAGRQAGLSQKRDRKGRRDDCGDVEGGLGRCPGESGAENPGAAPAGPPAGRTLFDLISVPHEAFKDIFLTTRNILQTKISPIVENPGVTYANDVWAYPQATVQINARNNEEFDKIFSENSDKIVAYFLKAERNRLAENYRKLYEKSVYNNLEAKFNIKLTVPPGFQISTEKENFPGSVTKPRKSHRASWYIPCPTPPTASLRSIISSISATASCAPTSPGPPKEVT